MLGNTLFLVVMLGVIAVAVAVSVPALFTKRCPQCGARNGLEATECSKCHAVFPKEA